MPSPATLRIIGYAYVALLAVLWPLTTLISTGYALKLKVPPLPRRRPRRPPRLESQMVD